MKWLILVGAVAIVVVAGVVLLGGDDSQKHVEVKRGASIPSSVNRADDYGADTLRAYLAAALACSPAGAAAMQRIGGDGEPELRRLLAAEACGGSGRPDTLDADVAQDDLDRGGRALWRVRAGGGELADGRRVWLAQQGGTQWVIDQVCPARGAC